MLRLSGQIPLQVLELVLVRADLEAMPDRASNSNGSFCMLFDFGAALAF